MTKNDNYQEELNINESTTDESFRKVRENRPSKVEIKSTDSEGATN
jgi:hypothetical protein